MRYICVHKEIPREFLDSIAFFFDDSELDFVVSQQTFTSSDAALEYFAAIPEETICNSEIIPVYVSADYLKEQHLAEYGTGTCDNTTLSKFKQENEQAAGHSVESIKEGTLRIIFSRSKTQKERREKKDESFQNQPATTAQQDLKAVEKLPSRIMKQNIPSIAKSINGATALFGGLHARAGNKSPLTTITRSPIYDSKHNIYRLILNMGMQHKDKAQPYLLISQLCNLMGQKFGLTTTGKLDAKSEQNVIIYLKSIKPQSLLERKDLKIFFPQFGNIPVIARYNYDLFDGFYDVLSKRIIEVEELGSETHLPGKDELQTRFPLAVCKQMIQQLSYLPDYIAEKEASFQF